MILRGSLCRATRLVAVAVRVLVGYIGKCVLEERTVNLKRRRCFSGRITCETSWKCSVSGIRVANQTWNCDYEHFYMSKSKWTLVCFVLFYGCRWSVLSNVIPQGKFHKRLSFFFTFRTFIPSFPRIYIFFLKKLQFIVLLVVIILKRVFFLFHLIYVPCGLSSGEVLRAPERFTSCIRSKLFNFKMASL